MTENVLHRWSEVVWIAGSVIVLFAFALAIVMRQRPTVPPGSRGHRPRRDDSGHEDVQPDGVIDSFAGEIQEAGGSLPPVVKLVVPAVLVVWVLYLITHWAS